MNLEWDTLVEELTKVHSFALKALHEKHQEEVKSWGLNPDTIVPGNYFKRDVKAAILHLAMEILTAYQQQPCDNSQGMSSAEAALFTNTKDSQSLFLWNIAAKFVRQELLIQIHTYNILDTYLEIQIGNCVEEVQKILSTSQWKSYGGKPAAEDAADLLEKQYLDRLISLLKKTSCNEKQSQLPLDEVQHQLKEDHCALTEKMVQDKYTSLLQAMANSSVTPYNTEYVVCFVLSQRHFRQSVMLLQDIFKVRKEEQEKLLKKLSLHDDINTMHFQEDLLNLFDNKTEARFLVADLQHVIKRIQLRACHVKELASGIKEYCSNKANILGYMEEAQCLEYELQTFTEQELKTLKEKLKELSESTMLSDHQCKGRTSEQNGDITLNDTDSFRYSQDKEVEVEQSHRKQIAEERMKLQDQLERGELSGLMKQKLIREHDETIGFLEKALQHNLDMLNIKLETDLMLKKKLEDTTQTDLDPPHGKSNLQSNDQKILSLLIENISVFQQAEQIAAARISNLGPQLYSSLYPTDTISSKPLESSSLLSLLKEVDSQLRTSAQSAKLLGDCKGPEQRGPFRDIQDLQLHCGGDLSPVLPEDLSAWEYVIYQYGIHILQLLKSHIDIGDLHLHISSSLPSGNDDKNAFSHSFFYQRSENNLFVSREYLQSVGSFTLLLVHCTSHIISDGFCDDFNPLFLRTFYQAIKVCFTEGFFTKYELSRHSQLNNPCSAQCRSLSKTYNWSKDNIDFIPQLISIKLHPAGKNSSHGEAVKTGERLPISELELTLKEKLAKRKKEFFANNLIDETCTAIKEESNQEWISTEHLLETLDQMNSELIKILEKEVALQNLQDLEGRCYHLKALCLERQHLIRNIEKLEEQITLHNNLV
ncbi:uncharacterized protein [Hyperolius riggenbachi]|uniref:uncharacterized protein n=1 Tax=Hyperolius riggenbachi TaxID=752182 RepID=UPI0035A39A53